MLPLRREILPAIDVSVVRTGSQPLLTYTFGVRPVQPRAVKAMAALAGAAGLSNRLLSAPLALTARIYRWTFNFALDLLELPNPLFNTFSPHQTTYQNVRGHAGECRLS